MFNCKTLVNLYFVGVYPEDVIALVHVYFMNALLVYVMVKLTEDKRCVRNITLKYGQKSRIKLNHYSFPINYKAILSHASMSCLVVG